MVHLHWKDIKGNIIEAEKFQSNLDKNSYLFWCKISLEPIELSV